MCKYFQICFLLFITFYLISRWILGLLKSCSDNDELYAGREDFFVFRISLWMCTCSLAISIGAVTLLPFSVLGAEILHAYPDSYYFKWLNWQLIQSLWNYVFALSNLSLFILLPFAYFFIESQGFRGQRRGIMTRVYETVAVCIMMIVVLICLADVVQSFLLSRQKSISLSLLSFTSVDLPFIYSCVSLIGVITLLITTPIGFARMFTVVSDHLLAQSSSNAASSSLSDEYDEYMVLSRLEYNTRRLRLKRNGYMSYDSLPTPITPPEPFLPNKPLLGYQKVLHSIKYLLAIVTLLLLTVRSIALQSLFF
ncbi:unnamed protein product [Anisakis simplex]|uniref:LIMR family protein (inferred by orthology to a C. elegans protein) n=1 Tax=Anisakis simplex TaxID=6269 RepID=A0A0M3J320_ANISI|nr:unnamed protein product [Anisakis simplex]